MIPYMIAGILAVLTVIFLSGFLKNRMKRKSGFLHFFQYICGRIFLPIGVAFLVICLYQAKHGLFSENSLLTFLFFFSFGVFSLMLSLNGTEEAGVVSFFGPVSMVSRGCFTKLSRVLCYIFWVIFGILSLLIVIFPYKETPTDPVAVTEERQEEEKEEESEKEEVTKGEIPAGSEIAKKAEDYLKIDAFSKEGLIEQLEYEGYASSDAEAAVDSLKIDWQKQADKKAKSYLSIDAFSKKGLTEQLKYVGFSSEEAELAVSGCGADWKAQAAKKAQSIMQYTSLSKEELVDQLEFEGFTEDEASYGASMCGALPHTP